NPPRFGVNPVATISKVTEPPGETALDPTTVLVSVLVGVGVLVGVFVGVGVLVGVFVGVGVLVGVGVGVLVGVGVGVRRRPLRLKFLKLNTPSAPVVTVNVPVTLDWLICAAVTPDNEKCATGPVPPGGMIVNATVPTPGIVTEALVTSSS